MAAQAVAKGTLGRKALKSLRRDHGLNEADGKDTEQHRVSEHNRDGSKINTQQTRGSGGARL